MHGMADFGQNFQLELAPHLSRLNEFNPIFLFYNPKGSSPPPPPSVPCPACPHSPISALLRAHSSETAWTVP